MRYGEPWVECYICGFDYPTSQTSRHYELKKLVCAKCADEPGHTDYLEKLRLREETDQSEQPVKDQGEV